MTPRPVIRLWSARRCWLRHDWLFDHLHPQAVLRQTLTDKCVRCGKHRKKES